MEASPKEKLRRLADDIKAVIDHEREQAENDSRNQISTLPETIGPIVGEWFISGVEKYLSGEEPNLEKALGLSRGRGAPRQGAAAKNYQRALRVWYMLNPRDGSPPLSKEQILDQFYGDDVPPNWKDLMDEQVRYRDDILAEITETMAAKISERVQKRVEARMQRRKAGTNSGN